MGTQFEELRRQAEALIANRRRGAFADGKSSREAEVLLSDALDLASSEAGLADWPHHYFEQAAEAAGRQERAKRLKIALYFGQHWVVRRLLAVDPALANDNFGLELALYDETSVRRRLKADPEVATRPIGPRSPILHLAFSRHIHAAPELEPQMLGIAEALVRCGADVNDGYPAEPDSPHMLSALYGALGHAHNLPLARWLLENGADPNDNESLYHSTEVGNPDGTRLLLRFGARVEGTNALLRAIDFNDHETVGLLLAHSADVNAPVADHPSGEPPMVIPALHQAARRMADGRMAEILIEAGADCGHRHCGHTPYAYARIYGNSEIADTLAGFGGAGPLDDTEAQLAAVADGTAAGDASFRGRIPSGELSALLTHLIPYPERLEHVKGLVAHGFDHDACDEMKMTPLHLAGWEGLPKTMEWLLTLNPALDHINGFGGDLLSTIIHGSENCPNRGSRDHIACARLALEEGATLGTNAVMYAGEEAMATFLLRWSFDHPGQVVEGGIH